MDWLDKILSINSILFSVWFPTVSIIWAGVFIFIYGLCALLRHFGLYHPNSYIFSCLIPWRPFYLVWNGFWMWWESVFSFGKTATAKFSGNLFVLASLYTPDKILLGRPWLFGLSWFQPVGVKILRHMVMIAGTGSGKTVQTQTLLGLHQGSSLTIDPKYQMMDTMSKGRKLLGSVYRLTPLRSGSHSWNIFDEIRAAAKREGESAYIRYFTSSTELILPKETNQKPFFIDSERGFAAPLMGFIEKTMPMAKRNLTIFRDLLMEGLMPEKFEHKADAFAFLLDEMERCTAWDGFISKGATAFKTCPQETQGNILIGLRAATKWLDITDIRDISRKSDFLLCDLKLNTKAPPTVFLGAPTSDIQGFLSPWFRLVTTMSMTVFEHIEGEMKKPCLYVLDECPSLGAIPQLKLSAAVLRSYGVRLLAITQDIDLLKSVYPDTWESFIGNADLVWWMGTNHNGNIDYLSKTLGTTTRKEKRNVGLPKKRIHYQERPLMYPDQIRRFLDSDRRNTIITRNGKRPMRLKISPYYQELPLWLYDADKNFKESDAKKWTRGLLGRFKHTNPKPKNSPDLTLKDAQALFGLTGAYSRTEIKQRADMLRGRFNPDLIATAQRLLEY